MTEETKLNCSVNHNYREGYQQGRNDAIDEVVRCFENRTEFKNMTRCECLNELRNLAYELKEQKNE